MQKLEIDSSGRLYAGVTKDGVYWSDSPLGGLDSRFGGGYQRFGRFTPPVRHGLCRYGTGGGVQEPGPGRKLGRVEGGEGAALLPDVVIPRTSLHLSRSHL